MASNSWRLRSSRHRSDRTATVHAGSADTPWNARVGAADGSAGVHNTSSTNPDTCLADIIEPVHEGKTGEIVCIERLGGLLKSYHRAAA